jgi:hypothetical protein
MELSSFVDTLIFSNGRINNCYCYSNQCIHKRVVFKDPFIDYENNIHFSICTGLISTMLDNVTHDWGRGFHTYIKDENNQWLTNSYIRDFFRICGERIIIKRYSLLDNFFDYKIQKHYPYTKIDRNFKWKYSIGVLLCESPMIHSRIPLENFIDLFLSIESGEYKIIPPKTIDIMIETISNMANSINTKGMEKLRLLLRRIEKDIMYKDREEQTAILIGAMQEVIKLKLP